MRIHQALHILTWYQAKNDHLSLESRLIGKLAGTGAAGAGTTPPLPPFLHRRLLLFGPLHRIFVAPLLQWCLLRHRFILPPPLLSCSSSPSTTPLLTYKRRLCCLSITATTIWQPLFLPVSVTSLRHLSLLLQTPTSPAANPLFSTGDTT